MCAVHLHVHMEMKSITNKVKGKLECFIKRNQIISSTIHEYCQDLNKKAGINLQDHCLFLYRYLYFSYCSMNR